MAALAADLEVLACQSEPLRHRRIVMLEDMSIPRAGLGMTLGALTPEGSAVNVIAAVTGLVAT